MAYKKEKKENNEESEKDIAVINPLGGLVRTLENNYVNGNTVISKYVNFNMFDNINKIDAYLNSKHTSGDKDSKNRDKPFFNIVTSAVNIWMRATDIDRKNIRVRATKAEDTVASFLATMLIQDWMRRNNFGVFLNDWGRTLARYGSSVVKFVEKEGVLHADVIPWNRLIVDAIDFEQNPVIEVLEVTEAQLRANKAYDSEMVEKLCNTRQARQTLDKQNRDILSNYIKLYEVHGNLPLSYLTGKEEDKYEFVQQMHVISYVAGKEDGDFDDFTLVSGREKNPYMITHLIKEDGRSMAIGAVEHLFEAQWMMNHTTKAIKDQLDLASKLIFQTSDGNFVGQNALSAIETGDILVHAVNQPLTSLANNSHDITSLQNFGTQWKNLAQEIVSTPDSLLGNTAPSGTAWRQVEALQQEAHSLFELMTENKGLAIENMFREYVIPHIKKKLNNADVIAAELESHDITKIDSIFLPAEAARIFNQKFIDAVLTRSELPSYDQTLEEVKAGISTLGNQRFIKPSEIGDKMWRDIFKDLEWDLVVDVTGESVDTQNVVTTLTTVLKTIATNPAILQDPNAKLIFNKILENTGAVSPIELSAVQAPVSPSGGLPQTSGLLANQTENA